MVVVLLVAGSLVTALLLRYVVSASLPFVLLITSLSPAALIVLLYIGYLVRTRGEKIGYLIPLKVLGIFSICMGLLIFLDFVLPDRNLTGMVVAKTPRGDENIIHVKGFEQAVPRSFYNELVEGSMVHMKVTRLFSRVVSITSASQANAFPGYLRSTWSKVLMAILGGLFLLPVRISRFKPNRQDLSANTKAFITVIVPGYIMSLIAGGFWIKMLFVHVFQSIDRM